MRVAVPQSRRQAYTLTELLLTVVLVLGLLGAVVFNFSSGNRTAPLDEGVTQVEALFRFARAHAASTGKQVRILFPEAESGDNAELLAAEAPGATVRVTTELDPIGAPGVFTDVTAAANYVASISDLVSIQQVQTGEAPAENSAEGAVPLAESGSETAPAPEAARSPFTSVTFYPDGTGDSIELVLVSRHDADARRFSVRISGLTGSIHRQLVDPAATETAPPAPATEAAAEAGK